jgi:CRP-like cAMP-binding protein
MSVLLPIDTKKYETGWCYHSKQDETVFLKYLKALQKKKKRPDLLVDALEKLTEEDAEIKEDLTKFMERMKGKSKQQIADILIKEIFSNEEMNDAMSRFKARIKEKIQEADERYLDI